MNPIPNYLPPHLKADFQDLEPKKQEAFIYEFERKRKSRLATFLLSIIGLHYAYLGRWGLFVIYLLTLGGIGIWWFVAIFLSIYDCRDKNRDIALEVMKSIK
jgi:TM2 domain-containing membrane protein YozV